MFPTLSASLLLSLGFGVAAIALPLLQSPLLILACVAAMVLCISLEAWNSEDRPLRARTVLLARNRVSNGNRVFRRD